jgi:hypothetical protein
VHADRDDLSAKLWPIPVALARNFGFSAKELAREVNRDGLLEAWNGHFALRADERVAGVSFSADSLGVALEDGRVMSVPLAWYSKLLHAAREQLSHWEIAGGGNGIH